MSYRSRDSQVADEVLESSGACAWCHRQTFKTTLGQYGARCQACYDAYCNDGKEPIDGLTRADKAAILTRMRTLFTSPSRDLKAWAKALKAREEAGERLSSTHRSMRRAALGMFHTEPA